MISFMSTSLFCEVWSVKIAVTDYNNMVTDLIS